MANIAIVGEGLIGRILTLFLLWKTDVRITIFGLSDGLSGNRSCGSVAAGMVAPISELYLNESKLHFGGMKSLSLWPELLQSANLNLNNEVFSYRDTLLLAHKHNIGELELVSRRIGSAVGEVAAFLESGSLINHGIETNANLANKCIFIKQEGLVNVPVFFSATAECLLKNGRVTYIKQNISNPKELDKDHRYVFDVRGIGAADKIKSLFSIRGEALEVYAPSVKIESVIRFIHPRYQLYIIPRGVGIYYVGATSIEAYDESSISVQSVLDLLGMLCFVNPAFSEARLVRSHTGCRPATTSGLPEITVEDNIITLNGFSRHGYLLGPSVCLDVIQTLDL